MNKNIIRTGTLIVAFLFVKNSLASSPIVIDESQAFPVSLSTEIESAFTSDSKVVDYQIIDAKKVVIFGRKEGQANFMAFDSSGKTLINRSVVVRPNFSELEQVVAAQFPYAKVMISGVGEQVVISGLANSDDEKERIYQMVGELLSKESQQQTFEFESEKSGDDIEVEFMTRQRYRGVINNLEVTSTKQVNVKLTIAEVSHAFSQEFGIEIGSGGNTGIFVDQLTSFSASDIVSVISAVGNESLGQVLAEPNLSVISGEKASFLVGGELPVVTVVDGTTNVMYKEFGVRLDLMAKVLRDDKIKLSLMPEVSSLDTQYTNETYDLPSLKTRRAQTTVELGDGQSFVLGGLLNQEDRESLTRIPYIGDIPVLGALFRHTETTSNKTELVIVATVNLVQPIKSQQIRLPVMERTSTLSRFLGIGSGDKDKTEAEVIKNKQAETILMTGGFKQ